MWQQYVVEPVSSETEGGDSEEHPAFDREAKYVPLGLLPLMYPIMLDTMTIIDRSLMGHSRRRAAAPLLK